MDIKVYPVARPPVQIVPAERVRDWFSPHAYKCLPMGIANEFGFDVVLSEDIEVCWNGGPAQHDVKIKSGRAEATFGLGTFTIEIGAIWRTPPGVSLHVGPVPNMDRFWCYPLSAIIETDRLNYPWFLTMRCLITKPILIRAGTRLARIMPVTVSDLSISVESEPDDVKAERLKNTAARLDSAGRPVRFYHAKVKHKKVSSDVG